MNSVVAELYLLVRRRTVLAVGAAWLAMSLVFGLVIPLIVHAAIGSKPTATVPDPNAVVAGLKPSAIVATTTGLYPLYGAALMLALGAIVFGTDFRNHTWATIFVQQPRRISVVIAKLVAVAVGACSIVVIDMVVMTVASIVIARAIDLPRALPAPSVFVRGLLLCALIAVMGTALGAVLAVVFRGVAVALAVGLIWMLAVENLMSSLSGITPIFKDVRAFFPGGSAGSLASGFGTSANTLPGVAHIGSFGAELSIVVAYIAISGLIAALIVRRRDA